MNTTFFNFFSKTRNFIKNSIENHKWMAIIILVIIIVAVYFLFFRGSKTAVLDLITVEKRDLTEIVSVTGKVKPVSSVDLSFEKGGNVSSIAVSVGDKVTKGQYLASVSNADLVASVDQAKANLKVAEVNLESLKNGSTPEQIALDEAKVQKAESDLFEAKKALIDSINDSYTKADDTIRNKTDVMLNDPRNSNVELKFYTDFQLTNDIKQQRLSIETALNTWSASLLALNNYSNIDNYVTSAKNNLEMIKIYLEKLASAVNNAVANSTITQTTIDTWKTTISTARASIATTITSLSTSANQYSAYLYTLQISKNQLAITKSGATAEQIRAQEATIDQVKAGLASANAQLAKSILRSPINGIITKVDIKTGETAQVGTPAISIITLGNFEIESFIPEADIAKIKIGNMATTTLDAYRSEKYFSTSVTKIDPAETIIDGVPTYKVTFRFLMEDDLVKSGMTANLDILTNEKFGVLAVPARSVYSDGDKRFVRMDQGENKILEKEVRIGIRGVDGYVEIVSGLNEGDKILSSPSI